MKIFIRQCRHFFLVPVACSLFLALMFFPLVLSPQRALAAPASQQSVANQSCVHVTYTVVAQWSGGFVANVTVTNLCSTPIFACWTVQFTFTTGQQITTGWNASFSQSGSILAATVCVEIPPGGSYSFGFSGIWSGSNPPPIITFNGAPV